MTEVRSHHHAHSEQHVHSTHGADDSDHEGMDATDAPLRDPVCGMSVTDASPHRHQYGDRTYYFCSAGCLSKFRTDPKTYVLTEGQQADSAIVRSASPAATTASAAPTIYTCPRHPQVRQPTPGNCPICGMALEPEMPTLDEGPNPEYVDFKRRFWWTLPLTVVVTVIAMFNMRLRWIDPEVQPWAELVLAAPVVWWAGWPFFQRWWRSLVHWSPNMWTLIGTGVGIAYLYSAVATAAPDIFPPSFRTDHGVAVYFEAAVVIVSLTLLGQLLELRARSQTSAAIKALLGLAPKTARRLKDDGSEEDIPLTHVHVGDRLRVRPGENANHSRTPTLQIRNALVCGERSAGIGEFRSSRSSKSPERAVATAVRKDLRPRLYNFGAFERFFR